MALAGGLVSAPGFAARPEPPAVHFELRAPAGCSSVEDFAAHVRKRSARFVLVAGPAPRTLLVEIQEQRGGVLRGSVKVVEADGATRSRRLKASSCAEAVEALSLIATVTLDPDALLAEPEPEPTPEPEPPPPPPPPSPPPPKPKVRPRAVQPSPAQEGGSRYRLSFGVAAAVLLNQSPEPAPGASAAVALELFPSELVSPFFRVSVLHAQRRRIEVPGGQANFAFTLPTLDVCPVRLGPPVLAVRPCAYGSLGLLEVWGAGTAHTEAHSRLSGWAGGALWAGLRLSEALEIIADGRAGAALRRDRFGFDNRSAFTTPTLGFSAELGVAGGFP